jgi:hypothetical protein
VTDARVGRKPNMDDLRRYLAPFPPAAAAAAAASKSAKAKSNKLAADGKGIGPSSTPSTSLASAPLTPNRQELPGIFPDGLLYEGYGGWHGLVEMACTFTCHHGEMEDATMQPQDLEVRLRRTVYTSCRVHRIVNAVARRSLVLLDRAPVQNPNIELPGSDLSERVCVCTLPCHTVQAMNPALNWELPGRSAKRNRGREATWPITVHKLMTELRREVSGCANSFLCVCVRASVLLV